jgi:hypothetical protein
MSDVIPRLPTICAGLDPDDLVPLRVRDTSLTANTQGQTGIAGDVLLRELFEFLMQCGNSAVSLQAGRQTR